MKSIRILNRICIFSITFVFCRLFGILTMVFSELSAWCEKHENLNRNPKYAPSLQRIKDSPLLESMSKDRGAHCAIRPLASLDGGQVFEIPVGKYPAAEFWKIVSRIMASPAGVFQHGSCGLYRRLLLRGELVTVVVEEDDWFEAVVSLKAQRKND